MSEDLVTSPTLRADGDIIRDAKGFSGAMTLDMTDEEIAQAWRIVVDIRNKWLRVFRSKFNDPSTFTLDEALKYVEQFEDEIKTELAEKCNVLATVNTVPLLEGQPMEIEWIGKMPGDYTQIYGMDHEKKEWEVKRAKERGEEFLGQKS